MNKPALFAETNGVTRHVVQGLSEEFAEEIGRMSGRCIDIGSGPGDALNDFILPELNSRATIVCSDVSENMVTYGKEKYKDNRRMSFVQLDIEIPILPKNFVQHFDNVTSFYSINWCQDMRRVFKNIFDLLRPGGTSLLSFLKKSPSIEAYKILAAMPRYHPYMKDADRHIPVYQHMERPRETLKALLKEIGFEVRHCSLREKSWIFNSRECFLNLMISVNPFIDRMPTDLKKEYRIDLLRETERQNILLKENMKNEGDYSLLFIHEVFVLYLKKPVSDC